MKKPAASFLLILTFLMSATFLHAQSRARRVGNQTPSATTTEQTDDAQTRPPVLGGQTNNKTNDEDGRNQSGAGGEEVSDDAVVRVSTTLVTVPVSVMDRDGKYIPYLKKDDFRLYENGAEQQIAYFASTEKPFTVALVIDTSRSTNYKMEDMQDAAIAFVDQLRDDDRVMVIAFDDRIQVLTEPTSDRYALREAIRRTRTGGGTRLYDAVDFIIHKKLNAISGRKAIVLFTDGVDTTSRRASYESTVRDAEEADALIYPVEYDTYEALGNMGGGGIGWPIPSRRRNSGVILGWPLPFPIPGSGGGYPTGRGGGGGGSNGSSRADYDRADAYLNDLAVRTGARMSRADSLQNINRSFELIAEELRRQYSLGYYPKVAARSGERRQIKVRMREPNLVVRSRDSYISNSSATVATQPSPQNKFAALGGGR